MMTLFHSDKTNTTTFLYTNGYASQYKYKGEHASSEFDTFEIDNITGYSAIRDTVHNKQLNNNRK